MTFSLSHWFDDVGTLLVNAGLLSVLPVAAIALISHAF